MTSRGHLRRAPCCYAFKSATSHQRTRTSLCLASPPAPHCLLLYSHRCLTYFTVDYELSFFCL
ncbi:240R [Invertebrate iridescent virus Kaz2018]|uniref:Uncharacterized protein 240R n=1 Tax=Invertebrate iridescent virus 6 TaxID=176652 RepID=240R_IIV6|nr:240R [Invertebrate iridescent virus 6]Q91FT2.1 RecName: Full=Uncharacterized protein 240R [Invertebrate iridescent virus 6]AAK82101.1 240R [Invertebrate iridescent virus 6]QNH08650.1 240R [Invertebrate iridescent virus Kaz2018]